VTERSDVLVIGGGVIGLACALALLEEGSSVRLVERDTLGSGASHGNLGMIMPSHALPLTRPGMMRDLLRWMWRSDSPVLVRPSLDPLFFAWGLRFARSCRREAMLGIMRGRQALLESSRDLYVELVGSEELDCEWEPCGLLEVFERAESMEATEPSHDLLEGIGVHAEVLDHDGLMNLEPALRDDVYGGRLHLRDARLRPEKLVAELGRVVRAKGAAVVEGTVVSGFDTRAGRVCAVMTDAGRFEAEHFVVAAGAWSAKLCRPLGLRLPVQPGKGYSITTSRPGPCPRRGVVFHEANMAVTPWESGYRMGGTMEFGGFDERLSRPRLEALRAGARRYLRAPFGEQTSEEWCGFRPMTPDELPILSRVPRYPNTVVATGHGMMGVSMAPATAKLVAEMVAGREPFLDVTPYSLARFGAKHYRARHGQAH
jgi:D-amino-acid dehydrogenase